jgi:phosphoribosylformylglycinamidine synthase
VIGICNGFQVLVRLGLLPWPGGERAVSLVENTSGLYEDRWVRLRVETDTSPLLRRGETFEVPVAHGEGRLVVRSAEDLDTLRARGQILLRYIAIARDDADAGAGLDPGYPANPNGSVEAIAGLQSPCGRVIGMMPHPERHLTALQHPNWTRRAACGEAACDAGRRGDGFVIFERMVAFAAQQAGAGVATSSGDRG